MAQVAVPNSYFVKARREYTDWTYAWWREAFQNAVDAGARRIDIRLYVLEDRAVMIQFEDNGRGMTEDVLVNGFLTMGGSVKESGSVGGFGYAKTLLLFSNDRYRVHTRDLLVTGSGGEYEIERTQARVGTELAVQVSDPNTAASALLARFRSGLDRFLANYDIEHAGIDLVVTINGRAAKLFDNSEVDNSGFTDCETDIGTLWFSNRLGDTRETVVWICVNSIPMFSKSVYSDRPLIAYLELKASSVDVLTSNRDNLVPGVASKVQSILTQLAHNSASLRAKPGIDFTVNETASDHAVSYRVTGVNDTMRAVFQSEIAARDAKIVNKVNKWLERLDTARYPENWRFMVQGDLEPDAYRFCQTARASRFAFLWKSAVCLVLDSILGAGNVFRGLTVELVPDRDGRNWQTGAGQFRIGGVPVQYGFCFRSDVEALFVRNDEISILVNPLSMRDDATDGDWLGGDLIDRAIHEVAHAWELYHNETFIGIMDKIREEFRRCYFESAVEKTGRELRRAAFDNTAA